MNMIVGLFAYIFVARLGHGEFAASALASAIYAALVMFDVGVLYAVAIKIGHSFGAGEFDKVGEYFRSALVLSMLITVPTILLLIGFALLLPYMGQDPNLVGYAQHLMYSLCFSIPISCLYVTLNQLVTGVSKPRIILVASAINFPLSVFLFYSFILGKFGFPKLGMWGVGVGYTVGGIFMCLINIIYLCKTSYFRQFKLLAPIDSVNKLFSQLWEIVVLGFPMGVQFFAEIAVFAVETFFVGLFGQDSLVAYRISNQIYVLFLMLPFALSEAGAVLVGQHMGEKSFAAARKMGFSAAKLSALVSVLIVIPVFIWPKLLIGLYMDVHNPSIQHVVEFSTLFLYVNMIFLIPDSVRNVITGGLRGLQDSKTPMYVGIIIAWVIALPLGVLFAFTFKMQAIGFLYGFLVAVILGALYLLHRFNQKTIAF